MKTLVVTIATPADGDLLIVNAEAATGGKTSVKHTVLGARKRPTLDDNGFMIGETDIPAQTPADIAAALAYDINHNWLPECVQARVKDDGALIISCQDNFSDVKFSAEVSGDGGTTLSFTEF